MTGTGIPPFTVNVELRSSLDNFPSVLGPATPFKVEAYSQTTNTPAFYSFNLSGIAAMQSITEEVSFRIYVWASDFAGTPAYFNSIRFDNFELSGNIRAIPEASSVFLLLGGIVSLSLTLFQRTGRNHTTTI